MQVRHNSYNLTSSKDIEISSNNLDIKVDVMINSNERKINRQCSISGIVVDTLNNPIKNAIVKLINNNLEPIANVRTDGNGKYALNIIPLNTVYTVLATSIEKIVSVSPSFTLELGENKILNFTLSNDTNTLLGAISGTLTNSDNTALKGAVILLYNEANNFNELYGVTYSDTEGSFLFSELLQGQYKIVIYSLNNMFYEEIIKVERSKIYNFTKLLNFTSNISEGSISGVVTDKLGNSISKAHVILYKIENNIKVPIAFTKTNNFGVYSFLNVPFGYYLVKSNSTESLDINNIISPSVKITATSELQTYNLSTGILENGAIIDSIGFVTSLGGKNDGSVTLNTILDKYGLYTLIIYYLAGDFNRSLKVNINGQDLKKTYKLPITPGWQVSDIKTIEILTPLNEGLNIIKFHGDNKNLAPNISMLTIVFNETTNNSMVTSTLSYYNDIIYENISMSGLYSNGGKYSKETFLATSLGGKNDGAVTVFVEVPDLILYYMQLKYVSNSPKLIFKMDINGVVNDNLYIPAQTIKTDSSKISIFTLPVAFDKNVNSIKFHGDGNNFSPDLDSFYLIVPPITQNLIEGFFENDAKAFLKENFIIGLGGPKNGAVTVAVDMSMYGYYKFYIEYVATTTTLPLKVDVNGINNSTITYLVPPTGQLSSTDKKIFSIMLYLNTGINTLRFYGNGKDLAPNLSSFKLVKTNIVNKNENINKIQDIYEITGAKLTKSATLDKDKKFITSLGGKTNGAATFNITVEYDGEYVLQTNYYYGNRNFKIAINEIEDRRIFKTSIKVEGIFKTTVNLKSGNNTLKIYDYYSELAPNFGNLMINLNAPLYLRLEDFFLYNNAKLLPTGIIKFIGGKNQGSVVINYFAYEYAEYTLNIVTSNDDKELLIKINDNSVLSVKNIPIAKSTTIAISKSIALDYGDNLIEFLGNGNNITPDIYSVNIKPTFPGPFIYTYNLNEAVLKNGASVNNINGFVKDIGTILKGTALLIVEMESDGFYDLNIQYINPYDISTPLRLKVNNKFIENTYYIPISESDYDSDKVKIFIIPKIQLISKINFIEFSGNGVDPVANLGKVRLSKTSDTTTNPLDEYSATEGKLENGAKIASFSKNFVDKLGGNKQQGSVTIKVNVNKDDFYELFVEYLVVVDNNNLFIDINGNYSGINYILPKTDALKEEVSKNFIVPIFLNKGDNTIKFYGDKINVAPSLGKININKCPEFTTYKFANAILNNANILDSPFEFVYLNGSLDVSSASIKVIVKRTDFYYLTFKYLSKNMNYINVNISNVSYKNIFNLEPTKSENAFDAKTFTIRINLKQGENTIIFSKLKKVNDDLLLLHSFSISTNILVKNIDLKKLFFFNGAIYDVFNGFISRLGGEKSGYVILNVNVSKAGVYDLYISYLSLHQKRKLRFEINDSFNMKNNYLFLPTGNILHKAFIKTISIPITLKAGANKIKISGKHDLEGPMISEITLSLNTENTTKFYYLSDGSLKGKVNLDNIGKTVGNIGGKENGEVTIKVNVPEGNLYNLQLQYKTTNNDNILLLDVNNVLSNTLSNFKKTRVFFNKVNIKIFLRSGDNLLRFYGHPNNKNLILGNFTLESYMNLLTIEKNAINFNIALGELKNGANVYIDSLDDQPWVENIGGPLNGSSTVTLKLDYDGEYSLVVNSYSAKDFTTKKIRTFTIIINSVSIGQIFYCAPVGKKPYEIILKLSKGVNKFKFLGDGTNDSPELSSATLTIKTIYNY